MKPEPRNTADPVLPCGVTWQELDSLFDEPELQPAARVTDSVPRGAFARFSPCIDPTELETLFDEGPAMAGAAAPRQGSTSPACSRGRRAAPPRHGNLKPPGHAVDAVASPRSSWPRVSAGAAPPSDRLPGTVPRVRAQPSWTPPEAGPQPGRRRPGWWALLGAAVCLCGLAGASYNPLGASGESPAAGAPSRAPRPSKARPAAEMAPARHRPRPAQVAAAPEAPSPLTGAPAGAGEPPAPLPAPAAAAPSPLPAAQTTGLQVAEAIRPCLGPDAAPYQIVAVYLQPGGKVEKAFIGRGPGVEAGTVRCVRQRLNGATLSMSYPVPTMVEWRFVYGQGETTVKLRRPVQ